MRFLKSFVFSVIPFCVLGCSDSDRGGVTEGLPDAESAGDAAPAMAITDGLGARDVTCEPDGPSALDAGATAIEAGNSHCRHLPMTQAESAPCCPEYGIDACGAHLFCAAFDGRTRATCYRLYSRLDGKECDSDHHCLSKDCNLANRRCRYLPAAECTVETGCSTKFDVNYYACAHDRCVETDREEGSPCATSKDCASEICVDNVCETGAVGSRCTSVADCNVEFCAAGLCSDGSTWRPCRTDADCTLKTCVSGKCQSRWGHAKCRSDDDCDSGACAACILATKATADSTCIAAGLGYSSNRFCLHDSEWVSGVCSSESRCAQGTCLFNPDLKKSQCSTGEEWSICTKDADCRPDAYECGSFGTGENSKILDG